MSEMVERVAKAIFECAERQLIAAGISTEMTPDDFKYEARAAIEAMREPTEGMLNNTVDEKGRMRIIEFTRVDERDKSFLMPRFTWRAMIDAALKK